MTRWPPLMQFLLISGGVHLSLLVAGVLSTTPTEPIHHRVGISLRATLLPTTPSVVRASPIESDAVYPSTESVRPSESSSVPTKAFVAETRGTLQVQPLRSDRTLAAKPPKQPKNRFLQTKATETLPSGKVVKRETARTAGKVETTTLYAAPETITASQKASDEQIAQWRSHLQAQLTEHMQSRFRYPLLARRSGWQGVVRLRFVVTNRGQIIGVELVSSSGYKLLDNSALHNAAQIQEIPLALEDTISVTPLRVEIPVRFLLRG